MRVARRSAQRPGSRASTGSTRQSARQRRRAAPRSVSFGAARAGSRRRTGAAGGAIPRPRRPAPCPARGVPRPCICRCCSAASSRRAMSDRLWKPTVAELPASECASADGRVGHALVRLERPLADFGGQLARPFVGFVEVDVVERDADAQRADDLDLVVGARRRPDARPRRRRVFGVAATASALGLPPRGGFGAAARLCDRERSRRSIAGFGIGFERRRATRTSIVSAPARRSRLRRRRPASASALAGSAQCGLDRDVRGLEEVDLFELGRRHGLFRRRRRLARRNRGSRSRRNRRRGCAATSALGSRRRPAARRLRIGASAARLERRSNDRAARSSGPAARARQRRQVRRSASTMCFGRDVARRGHQARRHRPRGTGGAIGSPVRRASARLRNGRGLPAVRLVRRRWPRPTWRNRAAASRVPASSSGVAGRWSASQVLSTCSNDQAASPNPSARPCASCP